MMTAAQCEQCAHPGYKGIHTCGERHRMTPWEKLEWLVANAHEIHVAVNRHRACYRTVAQDLEDGDVDLFDADEAETKAECIRRNELVTVQVYPDTPIGFYRVGHYEMGKAVEQAYECVRKERDEAAERHGKDGTP